MLPSLLPRQIAFAAAILGAVTPGRATVFSGPSCVLDCIGDDDCGFNSPKCMCKAAQGNLLNQVLNCMAKHCSPDELVTADQNFLSAMQILCSGAGHPIPTSDIASAEAAASSLLTATAAQPPPPPPTSTNHHPPSPASTGGPAPSGPAPTSTGEYISDSRPTSTGSGPSSADNDGATSSASSVKAGVVTSSDTAHVTAAGGGSTTVAPSRSSTTTGNSFPDPTDSSPFATPVGNAATLPRVAMALAVALPFAALFAL